MSKDGKSEEIHSNRFFCFSPPPTIPSKIKEQRRMIVNNIPNYPDSFRTAFTREEEQKKQEQEKAAKEKEKLMDDLLDALITALIDVHDTDLE